MELYCCVPLALTQACFLIEDRGQVSMYVGLFCVGICMPLRVPPCIQVWTKSACFRVYSPLSTDVRGLVSSEGGGPKS